jgi:hypothetical protein
MGMLSHTLLAQCSLQDRSSCLWAGNNCAESALLLEVKRMILLSRCIRQESHECDYSNVTMMSHNQRPRVARSTVTA